MTLGLPPVGDTYASPDRAEQINREWNFLRGLKATAFNLSNNPGGGWLLQSDQYGNGSWISLADIDATLFVFHDDNFKIYGHVGDSRALRFDLSLLDDEYALIPPNGGGTIAVLEAAQVFLADQQVGSAGTPANFYVGDPTEAIHTALGHGDGLRIYDVSDFPPITWQVLEGAIWGSITVLGIGQWAFSENDARGFILDISGATAAKGLTLKSVITNDRTQTLPDVTGILAADTSVMTYDDDILTYEGDLIVA